MAIERLLDLIRDSLSPDEGQIVVASLFQDPLVFSFIQDERKSLPYFEFAPKELVAYSPGALSHWLIEKTTGLEIDPLSNYENQIPKDLKQSAGHALETVLNTGLPPSDFYTAGLLALALRERRVIKGSWDGLAEEIFVKGDQHNKAKKFLSWRSAFSILYGFVMDFDDLMNDLLNAKSNLASNLSLPLYIHTLLSNPIASIGVLDTLFQFCQNMPIDLQLDCLRWLRNFNQDKLSQNLAKHFIQTKHNTDKFASIFSEVETLETPNTALDPLEKQIRFRLAEDLNRVAAFYYFSGDSHMAAETYQKSCRILDHLKSQTLFQAILTDDHYQSQTSWHQLVKTMPNSELARVFFVKALIQENKLSEAEKYLEELPNSTEKSYLEAKIGNSKGQGENNAYQLRDLINSNTEIATNNSAPYFVHTPKMDFQNDMLKESLKSNLIDKDLKWVEKVLTNHMNNPEKVALVRDQYEKANIIDRALELTSYLERLEPNNKKHKQDLARLYTLNNHWEKAFVTIQAFIKTDPSPKIDDLERFAESALMTNRVDMSIAICQNILKQESHNEKALILLGKAYTQKGDMVKAIQHMEQVVEMIPNNADTWLTLAEIWQENGQIDRAFEILNKGSLAIPNDPNLLRALGKAHLDRQAPADAIIYLSKAYDIEPNHTKGRHNLAQAKYEVGQYEEAWGLLKDDFDKYQKDPALAKLLGYVLLAINKKEKAQPVLIFAAKHFPEDLKLVFLVSSIVLDQAETAINEFDDQKLENIQGVLEDSLSQYPEEFQIHLYLADIARLKGEYQFALDSYSKLSEKDYATIQKFKWQLAYGLGKSAIGLGNNDLALAALQEANSNIPGNLMVLHGLAQAYQANNLLDKADKVAKSALKLAPQDTNNILWYADFNIKSGDPDKAIDALRDALQINSQRSELKLWLAKILLSIGSTQEVTHIVQDLILHSQASAQDLHQAAYLCIQINDIKLAVQALQKSLNILDSENPILVMDLALGYARIDEPQKALTLIEANEHLTSSYPEMVILNSDLLKILDQYKPAFDVLMKLENDDAFNLLASHDKDIISKSPLLYNQDYSPKGYFTRLGFLCRSLGDNKTSQLYLAKALEYAPDDLKLKNQLVENLIVGLEFEKALDALSETNYTDEQNLSSNIINQICDKAEIFLHKGQLKEARELLKPLSDEETYHSRFYAIKSQVAYKLEDFGTSEADYRQSVERYNAETLSNDQNLDELFSHLMTLNAIGEAAILHDDYKTALQLHQQAAQTFPNQPLFNLRYCHALIKVAEAQQRAQRLLIVNHAPGKQALSEENREIAIQIADSLEQHLTKNEMMCLKARLVAAFSGNWPLKLNADACLSTPDEAAAVLLSTDDDQHAKNILEIYPNKLQVMQAYCIRSLEHNNQDALEVIEGALKIETNNPINHALLALLEKNDVHRAAKALETALSFWPDEPKWHSTAADYYSQLGDTETASYHIAQALNTDPNNADFWKKSGEIRIKQNDLKAAKADLEKSSTIQSNDPQIWLKMADVNHRMGNGNEALENIRKANELDPDNSEIVCTEIKYLIEQNDFDAVEQRAKQELEHNQANAKVLTLLAQSYAKQGKFDLALDTLNKNSQKSTKDPLLNLEMLKIKKERDGIEPHLPDLIRLAEENPKNTTILTTLTDWLIQSNRLDKAKEIAQTVLRILPEASEVHLMLGRLQKKNGQLDQAVSHLSEAIKSDPFLVEAYIELGKTYQERRELEKAIQTFQKGSEINPADARLYYHAGMALKESKNFSDAELMLKEAKRYSPNDANIIRQLGVITALNLIHHLRERK